MNTVKINPLVDGQTIVTDQYLLDQGFSKTWIAQHARDMGAFCKPRRFYVKNITAFFEQLAHKAMTSRANRVMQEAQQRAEIEEIFQQVMAEHEMRDMKRKEARVRGQGSGGKVIHMRKKDSGQAGTTGIRRRA